VPSPWFGADLNGRGTDGPRGLRCLGVVTYSCLVLCLGYRATIAPVADYVMDVWKMRSAALDGRGPDGGDPAV
jgi:hypothetical protein